MTCLARRLFWITTFTAIGLVAAEAARADITITTPGGLKPGDTFRIVFVTDGKTNAESAAIDYYNDFVNTQAGIVKYDGMTVTFNAIASTSQINVITNIAESGSPVYLVDGTLVATSDGTGTGGLWSGKLISPIDEDLNGNNPSLTGIATWTGSFFNGSTAEPLGSAQSGWGDFLFSGDPWVDQDTDVTTSEYHMYGISEVLTVPAAVPEPSSAVLIGAALGSVLSFALTQRWWRRKKDTKLFTLIIFIQQ